MATLSLVVDLLKRNAQVGPEVLDVEWSLVVFFEVGDDIVF